MVDDSARPEGSPSVPAARRRRPRPSPSVPLSQLLATHNPLYAVSAALVFYGLRASFGTETVTDAWVLFGALAAYVVLLTGTALGLRRLGALWEDMRSLALLVLLLLIGISVTFDRTVVTLPTIGRWCFAIGWLLAAGTCELLLHGLRVRLPLGYRLPFHALLALFFIYPPIVADVAADGDPTTVAWYLAGFTPLAAVLLLTLLPAARRGAAYVADNGTPWRWPLFPMTLFALLGVGAFGRAYCLCYSMHFVPDGETIFGGYFAVPLLYAVGVLLLFAGRSPAARLATVGVPVVALVCTTLRPIADPTFIQFADRTIPETLGAAPTVPTLFVGIAFYAAAAWRAVPGAAGMLFASLMWSGFVYGPARSLFDWQSPSVWPFAAAGIAAVAMLIRRRQTGWGWAVVLSAMATAATATKGYGDLTAMIAGYHAAMLAAALVGTYLADARGSALRGLALALLLFANTKALIGGNVGGLGPLPTAASWYPAVALALAAIYAGVRRDRSAHVLAGVLLVEDAAVVGFPNYLRWRQWIVGLDAIVAGGAAFVAAVMISVLQTPWGARLRWRRTTVARDEPAPSEPPREADS